LHRFDSNYHYVVPEFSEKTDLKFLYNKPLAQYHEGKALGIETRPVVLGPLSYLLLGKAGRDAAANFELLRL